jgi:biotin carboxyl carrier protein
MKLLLSRGATDFEVEVTPDGPGYSVKLGDTVHQVEGAIGAALRVRVDARPVEASVRREGETVIVDLGGTAYRFRVRDARAPKLARRRHDGDAHKGELHAPMPGLVVDVLVEEGEAVEAGRPVVVVEAMKMQNALAAPVSGRVRRVAVSAGTAVESGALLLTIEPGAD